MRYFTIGILTLLSTAATSNVPVSPTVGDLLQTLTISEVLTLMRMKIKQDCASMVTNNIY